MRALTLLPSNAGPRDDRESEGRSGPLRVIGESPEWRQVLTKAAQVAATDTTVFLQGESGTGKEVVGCATTDSAPPEHREERRRVAYGHERREGAREWQKSTTLLSWE